MKKMLKMKIERSRFWQHVAVSLPLGISLSLSTRTSR